MTEVPNSQYNLIDLAMLFCQYSFLRFECPISASSHESLQNIAHLLALVHKSFTPTVDIGIDTGNIVDEEKWKSIPSAIELQEARVNLKKLQSGSFFDIKFNKGVLKIPFLKIEDLSVFSPEI
jgi:hypothetical protein